MKRALEKFLCNVLRVHYYQRRAGRFPLYVCKRCGHMHSNDPS